MNTGSGGKEAATANTTVSETLKPSAKTGNVRYARFVRRDEPSETGTGHADVRGCRS